MVKFGMGSGTLYEESTQIENEEKRRKKAI